MLRKYLLMGTKLCPRTGSQSLGVEGCNMVRGVVERKEAVAEPEGKGRPHTMINDKSSTLNAYIANWK